MISGVRVGRGVLVGVLRLAVVALVLMLSGCGVEAGLPSGYQCYGNDDCCAFHTARMWAAPDELRHPDDRYGSVSALAGLAQRGVSCAGHEWPGLTPALCQQTRVFLRMPGRASLSMVRAWRVQAAACDAAGM